jgi:branched-chain amino acid transport system permease protein
VSIGEVTLAFPKLTLVAEFIVMAIVLALRPQGLLGTRQPAAVTALPEQRELVVPPSRRDGWTAIALVAGFMLLPLFGDDYTLVLAIDILIATLFAASLQFLTGAGGMTSFGHAAYFGVGAYAAALAVKHGAPFIAAMVLAPVAAAAAALVFGWFCVRSAGVYLAMLTLAFAQITWSIAFQWDSVTGGSNGIVGVWPGDFLADRRSFFGLTLAIVAAAFVPLTAIANGPFGRSLRGARDAPLRAEAIGIDVAKRRWQGFVVAGGFAGIAGALFAFSKGSISPETLAIPRSIDVLVMVLLGGLNALFGPLVGAASFTWLQDVLARTTDYWRALVGVGILVLVLAFPNGIGGLLTQRARRR